MYPSIKRLIIYFVSIIVLFILYHIYHNKYITIYYNILLSCIIYLFFAELLFIYFDINFEKNIKTKKKYDIGDKENYYAICFMMLMMTIISIVINNIY